MSRSTLFSMLLAGALPFAVVASCHHEPEAHHAKPGEYPPLPPASGTPVGYIVDASLDLKLRDDQLTKLKELDSRLAAQDDEIDTQLRQIEKTVDEPQDPNEKPKRPQHAPAARGKRGAHNTASGGGGGAGTGKGSSSPEANKLHEMQDANDRTALEQAFAILDEQQRISVRKLLLDHGVEPPDDTKKPTHAATGDGVLPPPPPPTQGSGGNIPGTDVPGEP